MKWYGLYNLTVCQEQLSPLQPEALLWMEGKTRSLGHRSCVTSIGARTTVSVWRTVAAGATKT